MNAAAAPHAQKHPVWFLILFALAVGGGSIAYVPLLTVLLPLEITQMRGSEDVPALAWVTFFGAIVASLSNIAFGMLSDWSRTRTPWIITGLIASSALLIGIGHARDLFELTALIMAWQLALNMMLAPLVAWAGDCFPDSQKGVLGGALSLAPAMGAMAGSLVTFETVVGVEYRLELVAVLVAMLVLPAVIFGRGRVQVQLMEGQPQPPAIRRSADDPFNRCADVDRAVSGPDIGSGSVCLPALLAEVAFTWLSRERRCEHIQHCADCFCSPDNFLGPLVG